MNPQPKIGFIGIGSQGGPIAERIVDAGFGLTVWARRPEAAAGLVERGASAAARLADLGTCDIVCICVVDDDGVAEVMGTLLEVLAPGAAVVILSTIHPDSCAALAEQAAARGLDLVDAPVSGGGEVARAGKLTVMMGGSAHAVDRVRPVIDSFASLVIHLGGAGAGQLGKLVNNALLTAHLALADEAVTTGSALGLDRDALATLLAASSGRSYGVEVVSRLPSLQAFASGAALLRKDVGLLASVVGARGADASRIIDTAESFLAIFDQETNRQER